MKFREICPVFKNELPDATLDAKRYQSKGVEKTRIMYSIIEEERPPPITLMLGTLAGSEQTYTNFGN